jgi:cytochrome c oxidase subunit 2
VKQTARSISGVATLLLSGCSGVQSALDVAGTQNEHIHVMWITLMWVCGVMYALVMLFLLIALVRARHARVADETTTSASPATGLATTLRIWIALIVLGLFGLTFTSFAVDRNIFKSNQQQGLNLEVTGQQWWWDVKYDNDDPSQSFHTANELHLPVDVPVTISLRSIDVIHSFWVPNLHGKQDLIPGRDTDIHLHPTRVGIYRGQCAEFCGVQHAHMALDVIVQSREDFEQWRAAQLQTASPPADATAAHGQDFFMTSACPLCHTISGTDAAGISGPDLTHVASRKSLAAGTLEYSRGNLAAWISDPQGIKPGNHMPIVSIEPQQLQALTAYLDGLK